MKFMNGGAHNPVTYTFSWKRILYIFSSRNHVCYLDFGIGQ